VTRDEHLILLRQRYIAAVRAHTHAIEEMDAAAAERHALMVRRLQLGIMTGGGIAVMLELLDDRHPEVRGMAALALITSHPEEALATLRQLALLPGLMGFRASVALERWEKGELGDGHGD
jgi:hypothetical protein